MNKQPCDSCSCKIWDYTRTGFRLICYGNDIIVPVAKAHKEIFTVPECRRYRMDTSTKRNEISDAELHRRSATKPRQQSSIEVFA